MIEYNENGLQIYTFAEIKADLKSKIYEIFGTDIEISDGTPYGILINTICDMLRKSVEGTQNVFSSLDRNSAVGTQLDAFATLVNVTRRGATNSTVDVELQGIEGTVIRNGIIADTNGVYWNLPQVVTIKKGEKVTATCNVKGSVFADSNTVNIIVTQFAGWTSVNNEFPSGRGLDIETDAQLRYRIKTSFGANSIATIESVKANIEKLDNVNSCVVYENDTASPKAVVEGSSVMQSAHSICCVVDGGDNREIAETILAKKTPGCGTFGTTTYEVATDFGTTDIQFYKASQKNILTKITLNKTEAFGVEDENLIKKIVNDIIINTPLGEKIYASNILTQLIGYPNFSVINVKIGTSTANQDLLTLQFFEKAYSQDSLVSIL